MNKMLALCAALVCLLDLPASGNAATAPSSALCQSRSNDTEARLLECIEQKSLWDHLAVFQKIADEHPDKEGHGNRDTGTPGYKASVDYVAGLMRHAGYRVTIQPYKWKNFGLVGTPVFDVDSRSYPTSKDWFVARLSGSGTLTALVQPVNNGCSGSDFGGFVRGRIALLERGSCAFDAQVTNATAAGAAAVILANRAGAPDEPGRGGRRDGGAYPARLTNAASIPVVGVISYKLAANLSAQYGAGHAPAVHLDIRTRSLSDIDYNVIADSPYGDHDHVVVVDGHLDSIYGAGILDNASGSTTMLEIALAMARTHTRNQLRYIWFGGEEIALLGSRYYTRNLSPRELRKIVFDIDVDVTATPNFDILVADPARASDVKRFPPNVVPDSRVGNDAFADYFQRSGVASRNAVFGNDGTDSNSFSLVGVPNSGILTQQDCCKHPWEVKIWGGFLGDYEGTIPGYHQACVDDPHRWCDNLSNNDPFVLDLVSKAVAEVTLKLANNGSLGHRHGD
jgi:Zn-dependent M28 family amino/carboxypeptidase